MSRKLFGTDGIRGRAGISPIDAETALRLGAAAGIFFKKRGNQLVRILIGRDTRISGSMLESAIAAGFASEGICVVLAGVIPTPGISFGVRKMGFDAGVVISASHNPYYDNGIKFFNNLGKKLSDEEELEIENYYFSGNFSFDGNAGIVSSMAEPALFYKEFLVDSSKKLDITIALDCANGAAFEIAPEVFKKLGANLVATGTMPDGININEKCGALYPEIVAENTKNSGASIGIALDGDSDRLILSDELGNVIDGDQIIGIAALYLKERGRLPNNSVVTTVMSNAGLEIFLKNHGITMLRASVGDRYVSEMMEKSGSVLGGENSGHIIFEINPTGDGILSAIQILNIMKETGKSLSELASPIKLFPQIQKKVKVKSKPDIDSIHELVEFIKEKEAKLSGGRILVRYSGTEPILRVMAEGADSVEVQKIVDEIAEKADFLINNSPE